MSAVGVGYAGPTRAFLSSIPLIATVDSLAKKFLRWLILGILAVEAATKLRHDEAKAYAKYSRNE